MFAAGAMALFVRKASQDQWAEFPKLLILAIPCVLLYGLGTGDIRIGRDDDTPADARAVPPWRAAALHAVLPMGFLVIAKGILANTAAQFAALLYTTLAINGKGRKQGIAASCALSAQVSSGRETVVSGPKKTRAVPRHRSRKRASKSGCE